MVLYIKGLLKWNYVINNVRLFKFGGGNLFDATIYTE